MVFKLAYDSKSEQLKEQLETYFSNLNWDFESFKEDSFRDRKKSFKLKGGYGAKQLPFGVLIDDKKPLIAFYTEAKECTLDNISKKIKKFI